MEIRSTVTPEELREAVRLARPRYFWLRFAAANWYATLLLVVVIVANVNAVIHHQPAKWNNTLLFLVLVAALYGFSWYRWNSKVSKAATSSNVRSSLLSLDSDGIRTKLDSGASSFVPWASYSKWAEGRSVFLLSGRDGTMVIPADDGSRDSIRELLQSKIV